MIITEDIAPSDLTVVCEAWAALAAAQPRQNGALLEALVSPDAIPVAPIEPSVAVATYSNGQDEPGKSRLTTPLS
jgi:hypothetical protein